MTKLDRLASSRSTGHAPAGPGARADDRKTDDSASQADLCKPLPPPAPAGQPRLQAQSALTDVARAYAAMSCKRLKVTGDLFGPSGHRGEAQADVAGGTLRAWCAR